MLVSYLLAHLPDVISETNFFFWHVDFAIILTTVIESVGLFYAFEWLSGMEY